MCFFLHTYILYYYEIVSKILKYNTALEIKSGHYQFIIIIIIKNYNF